MAALAAVIGVVVVVGGLLDLAGPGATGAPPSATARPSGSTSAATAPSGESPASASAATPSASAASPASATAPSASAATPSASAAAPASATPAADPVLIGAGDIARCDGTDDEATAALLESTSGIVFTLGDNAYDSGSTAQLRDCYGPSWGRVLDRTRFVVTGNHDIRTDDGAPEAAYFGTAAVRDGVTWFSEDVGAWHVIVLDANCGHLDGGCGADSAQVRWLRDDLAASSARCTLALWHQPRFSSGEHGNDAAVGPFWDALYAAGADLVLNGHDHDYERFAPQDPDRRIGPGARDHRAGRGDGRCGPARLRGDRGQCGRAVQRRTRGHRAHPPADQLGLPVPVDGRLVQRTGSRDLPLTGRPTTADTNAHSGRGAATLPRSSDGSEGGRRR